MSGRSSVGTDPSRPEHGQTGVSGVVDPSTVEFIGCLASVRSRGKSYRLA